MKASAGRFQRQMAKRSRSRGHRDRIPPSNDLESAIVRTLNPGGYTAVVSGEANTTGVALVEVYQLNN